MNYIRYSADFVANSALTALVLASNQNGTNGLYFDSISVVPEPSTLILASVGSLGLIGLSRARRRTVGPKIAGRPAA